MVQALISNLKTRYNTGEKLFESDYSRIMAAILPNYFVYNQHFSIGPEIWSDDKRKSDFVVCSTFLNRNGRLPYGHNTPIVMVECKNRAAISWWLLCKDQLWDQSDSLKNNDGRLWVIGQIGFEVCFFRFDVLNFRGSENYCNFSPLNLRNLSELELLQQGIEYLVESVEFVDVIQVIKWRLDVPNHHAYIHEMFLHISNHQP